MAGCVIATWAGLYGEAFTAEELLTGPVRPPDNNTATYLAAVQKPVSMVMASALLHLAVCSGRPNSMAATSVLKSAAEQQD